ncbi:UDP-glucose 4-epimerase [Enterovibrio norvegicus FF-454]|uniref:UDP-glucose 4-epimerase n=1 Tax=Enterovibrio norvegicus FF-454 TaxID=1185651 RepID=A0A1E5C7E3_9GAMM|nr:NAD-dependent epimerase/dehydratase family protein [Enterovibrio norvegicus]OEE61112.1 UDP-glucose 4-epimerase [Enterovibrio norvegicus FF-454]
MNILLTGSTGFVGKHLANNYRIHRQVVRDGEKRGQEPYFTVESINEDTDWNGAFDGVDVVIHLAGLAHSGTFSCEDYQSINTQGTVRLAHAAAKNGVKRFVFVSSIGVNGTSTEDQPFTFDETANPHNAYAQSKYNAELGLKQISENVGLEVVIVRPTLVYGPNAPGNFGMLAKLASKVPVLPFGVANNRRDFIAVQNLVDLLVTCATHPEAAGHTFLASDGEAVSTKDFTNAIAKGVGKKILQLPIPIGVMRLVGKLTGRSPMIEQLYGNLEVDPSNIKEVLGWIPPLTMEQAMTSLRDSGKINNDSYD